MTHLDAATEPQVVSSQFNGSLLHAGASDVLISLLTGILDLAVLFFSVTAAAGWTLIVALHFAVLLVPVEFCRIRSRRQGDLTIPVLLLLATFASGPVGAFGCACLAFAVWVRRPSPLRLRAWYDYIAGIVERDRIVRIYEELSSGRLPSDPAAAVPRFRPILRGLSTEEQQRVLGVIGRRYHADFRLVLREALRNKNGFIRAQAAAVASSLGQRGESSFVGRRSGRCSPQLPSTVTLRCSAQSAEPRRARARADRSSRLARYACSHLRTTVTDMLD